jgi:ADP-ribosylglycohydrolase
MVEVAATFGASGYVVESVPLAIYGCAQLRHPGEFSNVLESLISCGGDTDTIASMAGQLMGACLGKDALPDDLVQRIPHYQTINDIAYEFAGIVATS